MSKFVLTAQLQLQAPTNTRQVINQLRRELEGLDVTLNVKGGPQATRQIKEVTKRTQEATNAANKMGKAFGASIKRFAAFNIATRAVGLLASKLAQAVDEAIEFQRQLVKISQVTGKSTKQLQGLVNTVTKLSTTLGVSSTSLLATTRILAQAGIKAGDLEVALEALAKTTLAPTFDDITQTAEGAVAILAQFGQGVGALEKQLGAINAVSKQFAVESGDLISSVRRMGGVFKSAGGNLNELIALFTSVRATTRENAESIATGLRTIFTRIQRPTTIAYLKQLGVELTDVEGKFVGPYEAVRRLSQAFADIPAGDLRFVKIAEELGGFRQIGKVIPLIQQFTIAERARQAAIAGGDSLNKDAITAQQALAVQIEKTREKFLALIRGISETSSFQIMIKSLLGMANAFIKVAESIKPLIPLITVFAGLKLAKGIGGFARGLGAGVRGKNQGGKIHAFASGGSVPGSGNRDTVPAMLTPGEFVIRKSSVNKIGAGTLAAMNENKYAAGGRVIGDRAFYGALSGAGNPTSGFKKYLRDKNYLNNTTGKGFSKLTDKEKKDSMAGFDKSEDNLIEKKKKIQEKKDAGEIKKKKKKYPGGLFTTIPGQIGGFFLNPETKGEKGFSNSNDIPFDLPGGPAAIKSGSTLAEFMPHREDLRKNRKVNNFVNHATKKGLISSVLDASPKINKFLDMPDINVDDKQLRKAAAKLARDKQAVSTTAGYLFEGIIQGITGAEMAGETASFDFPNVSSSKPKLAKLFTASESELAGLKKADAKRSRNSGNFHSIFDKIRQDIQKGDLTGVKKFASGGSASGSDTVPAMLTPGEFVVNKKASQGIGYGNLNKMNKQGVVGFAAGGTVTGNRHFYGNGPDPAKKTQKTFDFESGPSVDMSALQSAANEAAKKVMLAKDAFENSNKVLTDLNADALALNSSLPEVKARFNAGAATQEELDAEVKKLSETTKNFGSAEQDAQKSLEALTAAETDLEARISEARAGKQAQKEGLGKGRKKNVRIAPTERAGHGAIEDVIAARTPTKAVAVAAPTAAPADARKSDVSAMKKSSKKAAAKKDDCKCEKMAAADCKCEYEAAQRIIAAISQSTNKLIVAIQKGGGGPGAPVAPVAPALPMEPIVQAEEKRVERKEEEKETDDKTGGGGGGFGNAEKFLLIAGAASATMAQFADQTTESGKAMIEFNNGLLAAGTSFAAVKAANEAWMDGVDKKAEAADKKVEDSDKEIEKQWGLSTEAVVEQEVAIAQQQEGAVDEVRASAEKVALEDARGGLETTQSNAVQVETDKRKAFEKAQRRVEEHDVSTRGSGPGAGREASEAAAALNRELVISERQLNAASEATSVATAATESNAQSIRDQEVALDGAQKKQEEGAEGYTQATEKRANAENDLLSAQKKAPGALRKIGNEIRKSINSLQRSAAVAAQFGTAALSAAKSLLESFAQGSKDREAGAIKEGDFGTAREEFKTQQSLGAGQDVIGKAAMGAMLGSIFGPLGTIVGGLIGAFMGLMDVVNRIKNIEKAREKQNQKIADAAIAQSKEKNVDLEKAFLGKGSQAGQDTFDGMQGAERRERFITEASSISRKAGTEVGKVKDPKEKQKRVEQLAAEEVRMVGIIASRATTEEEAIAAIAGFDDGVGATKDELIKAAKASYALAAAQRSLTKANYDSLKITSTFNAANLAVKSFVSSLDGGTSSLDGYIEKIEASQKNLGIDASASIEKAATELAGNPNLSQGAKDTIDRQKETALKVNDFGLKIGQEIQNLDLSASDPEKAKAQLESKLIGAAGGDKDLEAVIRSELANIDNVANADISTVISGIQAKAGQLSAGFLESAKVMNTTNKIITDLTNKRRASELKLIETQKQAIETQIEASKIIAEFGGDKFTPQKETAARVKQFNLSSRDAGVGGLTTGSAVDIGNVSAQLQAEFKNQQGLAINQAAGGAKAFGEPTQQVDADKRKELASAQKQLIGFTKQRVAQLREELSIIQKKNKLEKDSLEALVTGDIEGFLKGQAAAGAGAAIRSGNTSLLGNFDSEAIGKAFQDAKASGLTGDELRPFAEAGLNARGITSTSSIDTLAGTTAQEQAVMEEGRRLGQVLGGLADQLVELDSMNVTAANVTIQTANRKRDQAIQQQNALFSSGGVVYANRGIFVPRGTDTIPAMLTPGEFVVNRSSVQRGNNLAILQAMNNGQQAAPGPAMNRGGSVRYYSNGSDGGVQPGGGGFSISPETVTSLNNAFSGFSTAVDKLVGMQLSVKLDATNVNVNFSGTSFLANLTDTIRTEVLAEVKNQIPNITQNMAGESTYSTNMLA